jgi:hypothetical protein
MRYIGKENSRSVTSYPGCATARPNLVRADLAFCSSFGTDVIFLVAKSSLHLLGDTLGRTPPNPNPSGRGFIPALRCTAASPISARQSTWSVAALLIYGGALTSSMQATCMYRVEACARSAELAFPGLPGPSTTSCRRHHGSPRRSSRFLTTDPGASDRPSESIHTPPVR